MAITQEKIMETGFKIMQDQELMGKLAIANTPQEAFAMIADRLDGISFEEFSATVTALIPMIPQFPDEQLMTMPNGPLFIKIKQWIKDLPVA